MHFTLTERMRACLRQILKDANNKLTKEKEVIYILKSSETVQVLIRLHLNKLSNPFYIKLRILKHI